jgi:hemoglobin
MMSVDVLAVTYVYAHRVEQVARGSGAMTYFERIGGEEAVRALVDRFYDLMDALPEVGELRALHPPKLDGSRDKLAWFLTGWLGGPPRFVERFGHPRLRARHLPFAIGVRERDQWMHCMMRALDECVTDEALRKELVERLAPLADHMRNVQD